MKAGPARIQPGPAGLSEADAETDTGPGPARRRQVPDWLLALLLPAALMVAWEWAVRAGVVSGRLMPPPSRLAASAAALAASGELAAHVAATMTRVAAGFLIGAAAGTALGAVTGTSSLARRLLDPSVQAVRAVPSIAWVPLFILWLGIFETSKVALVALGVFFPVYLGVLSALRDVDRKLLEVGRVFGLHPVRLALRVALPAILPSWVTALRSGLGLGFMFVLAAELLGASEGLGYLLLDGQQMGRADTILVAMLTFAVLGKLCDAAFVAVSRPLVRWQDTGRDKL